MSNVHGSALKKHISCLVKVRIAAALDGAADVVMEWQVLVNDREVQLSTHSVEASGTEEISE